MSEGIVKAMGDLYGRVSFGGGGGGRGGGGSRSDRRDGPNRGQMGGRGGPRSQEQAVRNAQNYHATGSFSGRNDFTAGEKAVAGGIVGGAIAGARGGPVGIGLGALGGAVTGYIATR